MNAARLLAGYRVFFCLLLSIASAQTLMAEQDLPHVMPLASAEILGALLLCWRRTQWFGLTVLLVVFAGAQLLAASQGVWPTRFLQYAGSALLIVLLDRALRAGRALPRIPEESGATARRRHRRRRCRPCARRTRWHARPAPASQNPTTRGPGAPSSARMRH